MKIKKNCKKYLKCDSIVNYGKKVPQFGRRKSRKLTKPFTKIL